MVYKLLKSDSILNQLLFLILILVIVNFLHFFGHTITLLDE